jgi:hypothetical protein
MVPALWLGVMHVLLHHYDNEVVYLALRPRDSYDVTPSRKKGTPEGLIVAPIAKQF